MQTRMLGRTGESVSILGLGCGAVGGLMVRGTPADQERVVARAIERGVTYLDTAPAYGDGQSETNLGRVLATLRPTALVGTKLRLTEADKDDLPRAVTAGIEASLHRLGREQVDLYQLHNPITIDGAGATFSANMVLHGIVPAFERLRQQGKIRFIGITAVGETDALLEVIDSLAFDTAQVAFNLLNPTAAAKTPPRYRGQDYRGLLGRMEAAGMGAIGIRVLAGGALTGSPERHPIASPPPEPIGSGDDYQTDLTWAEALRPLVTEGHAGSLVEAAIRFVTGTPALATTLIGIATLEQFEAAGDAVALGPLSEAALARVRQLQEGLADRRDEP